MERREFIGAVAAAGLAGATGGWAQSRDTGAKKDRICIMMFGLNSLVKNNFPPSPDRTLDMMEFGELCADRWGVHQIELQSNYFPSTEMSWLKDYKARLAKTKTKLVQVNLELGVEIGAGMQLCSETPVGRLHMIDLHRAWFEKLSFLGCPRALINQGRPTPENKEVAIKNLQALVAAAKPFNVQCASENRNQGGGGRGGQGGPGAPAARAGQPAQAPPAAPPAAAPPAGPSYPLLIEVMRAGGGYVCVDMLNFPNEAEQHDGIRAELPYTSGLLHVGMRYDLPKAMAICRELKYNGIYSIKATGAADTNPLKTTDTILEGILANM